MDLISYILSKKYTDKGLAVKADLISGKVPASELPSYVDDVEEYEDFAHFPAAGEEGKIYVAIDTGFTYRWTGSQYVQIGGGTTYSSFNASWPTTGTTKAFCDAVNADTTVAIGKAYLGGATFTDLPFNGNGDIVVEILQGPSSTKSIHLILTSGDIYPYRWEYTYWNNGSNISGWIGYQPELPSGNNDTYLHKNASTGNLEWSNIAASGIDTTGETAGKVLTANGTGGASWQNPSGMANPMTTQGDVIIGGTSGAPTRLAKGNAGQVLSMNSAGTLPEWSDKPIHFIKLVNTTITEALRTEILSDDYYVVIEYSGYYFYERENSSGTKRFYTIPPFSFNYSDTTNYSNYVASTSYYFYITSTTSTLTLNQETPKFVSTSSYIYSDAIKSKPNSSGTNANTGEVLRADGSGNTAWGFPSGVEILTTAPVADNTNGLKFVVLSSEPATRYSGYLYIITGSN